MKWGVGPSAVPRPSRRDHGRWRAAFKTLEDPIAPDRVIRLSANVDRHGALPGLIRRGCAALITGVCRSA